MLRNVDVPNAHLLSRPDAAASEMAENVCRPVGAKNELQLRAKLRGSAQDGRVSSTLILQPKKKNEKMKDDNENEKAKEALV
jgi:hypothetical protein